MKRTRMFVQTVAAMLVLALLVTGCGNSASTDAAEASDEDAAATAVAKVVGAMDAMALPVGKANLNTATDDELLAIPGMTDTMLGEFKAYRPYVSIEQFRREIGKSVDEAQVTAYEAYVFVPIDINESDEATLQQIPGVDADAAAQLVAGRPYASQQAFVDALMTQAPNADIFVATGLLVAE